MKYTSGKPKIEPSEIKHLNLDRKKVFEEIYRQEVWVTNGVRSGVASQLNEFTQAIRQEFPRIAKTYEVRSICDVPCGDMTWMSELLPLFEKYTGLDISRTIIEENQVKFQAKDIRFEVFDAVEQIVPVAGCDMIFSRDMFMHLSLSEIELAIRNFLRSSPKYLFFGNFSRCPVNLDISAGDYRPVNLCESPFNFPEPIDLIPEPYWREEDMGRNMSLWKFEQLSFYLNG